MKRKTPAVLLSLLAVFLIGQGFLQREFLYPNWSKNFSPKQKGIASDLSPDQLLVALAGFREMIAGILWVKADSFFDSGNYDAILPIIRLVTWLDPKQIDVYATGMWHIGYNFTDEEQRSDRRYIPSALALGKEGAERNPETYEMFFETGWMWYHKIMDFQEKATSWFEKAAEHTDMMPARRNLLSMAYQRSGQIDKALQYYYDLLDVAEKKLKEDNVYGNLQNRDTIENNIDTMLVRMVQRGWMAQKDGTYTQGDYDTRPPFDVGFSAQVTVEEANVLRVKGTYNVLPVGTRIRFILRDADYPGAVPGGLNWDANNDISLDPPKDKTYLQDELFVKNRRFDRRVDMSKDPTMYPFSANEQDYVMEFYYDPRNAPPHIQDKFGWNGEGMTDKNFLRKDIRPGRNVLFATLKISRDQIKRRGEWADKVPIIQTFNYQSTAKTKANEDIIQVPNLRSGQTP